MFIFLVFIGYRVLKRDTRNRLNQVLSLFFFTVAGGLLINNSYGFISDPSLQQLASFLNILTIFLIAFSTGFLMLFILMIYKPKLISTTKLQVFLLLIYGMTLIGIFFIPNGAEVRILEDGTQLSPIWSLTFTIYISVYLINSLIILLIFSIKTYYNFENKILAKRLKLFILGSLIFYYIALGAVVNNYLNNPFYRIIYAISTLITFVGALFIYYSIGTNVNIPYPTNLVKY